MQAQNTSSVGVQLFFAGLKPTTIVIEPSKRVLAAREAAAVKRYVRLLAMQQRLDEHNLEHGKDIIR